MSCQKGNGSRTRSQKHQNGRVFKNNLHDTSHTTKMINNINVNNVCLRCKEIIEWKIKYKKYKPLSQPKHCVRCNQKTVKQAYHVMCRSCGDKFKVCTKCCEAKEVIAVQPNKQEKLQLDLEMQNVIKSLPERKRRTFFRYLQKIEKDNEGNSNKTGKDDRKEELTAKLEKLKLLNEEDEFSDGDFSFDESGDSSGDGDS